VTVALTLPSQTELRDLARKSLMACGASPDLDGPPSQASPINGRAVSGLEWATAEDASKAIDAAHEAFLQWRMAPAPLRGAVVKRLGQLIAEHKKHLAMLVSIEVGKITSEALGEIQEMVDICDFAVGLSRQLYGRTMASERPGHRLMETWHPLGVVGVISAFNFPAAVWSWNTAIALVCGDTVVWKPSETTPLTSIACASLLERALLEFGHPPAVSRLVLGGSEVGQAVAQNDLVRLVSATGSTQMGRAVAPVVAARFGRLLLELGGNNAAIVTPTADVDLAIRGIVFAAAGTAGQRCTTMRRVIAHRSVVEELGARLGAIYDKLPIGDPLHPETLVGPLINGRAWSAMSSALQDAAREGGQLLTGGERLLEDAAPDAYYARPALVQVEDQSEIVMQETFAPLLYLVPYDDFDEALALNNGVPQGLSSSIFTRDQRESERFMAADGSDCGIVNVNIGTSGAEIGGAFGGEKETGGGRESGSDAWRSYMRRATNTINYSSELPLAQGVNFDV
jgi:acyl-CoA reductase-like NAD-dependent aldehyde dehydrogenase